MPVPGNLRVRYPVEQLAPVKEETRVSNNKQRASIRIRLICTDYRGY